MVTFTFIVDFCRRAFPPAANHRVSSRGEGYREYELCSRQLAYVSLHNKAAPRDLAIYIAQRRKLVIHGQGHHASDNHAVLEATLIAMSHSVCRRNRRAAAVAVGRWEENELLF